MSKIMSSKGRVVTGTGAAGEPAATMNPRFYAWTLQAETTPVTITTELSPGVVETVKTKRVVLLCACGERRKSNLRAFVTGGEGKDCGCGLGEGRRKDGGIVNHGGRPRRHGESKVGLSVALSPDVARWLKDEAGRTGMSVSGLVEKAVAAGVWKGQGQGRGRG